MGIPEPTILEVTGDLSGLDEAIEAVPNCAAVFLIRPREGAPYLARTGLLRRRLKRMLGERTHPSRLLNLRQIVSRIEYWPTGSGLEATFVLYELGRRHFPGAYLKLLNLRMPPYVKIVLSNPFPRSQITTRLGQTPSLYYGPFRSRSAAEQFESQVLDLFQMRRCQEDLDPSPSHPGCIYGEMNMCLRPCQQRVTQAEYQSEVGRVVEFLSTDGRSLSAVIASDRDRRSEQMNFEEAARQHKRLEKIQQILKLADELARDIDRLCGVSVTPSVAPDSVELWFVLAGRRLPPRRFDFGVVDGKTVSLDQRLREVVASLRPARLSLREKQEQLALLARWCYSSWRDGEWLSFGSLEEIPYRKLVRAISRVAAAARPSN